MITITVQVKTTQDAARVIEALKKMKGPERISVETPKKKVRDGR